MVFEPKNFTDGTKRVVINMPYQLSSKDMAELFVNWKLSDMDIGDNVDNFLEKLASEIESLTKKEVMVVIKDSLFSDGFNYSSNRICDYKIYDVEPVSDAISKKFGF